MSDYFPGFFPSFFSIAYCHTDRLLDKSKCCNYHKKYRHARLNFLNSSWAPNSLNKDEHIHGDPLKLHYALLHRMRDVKENLHYFTKINPSRGSTCVLPLCNNDGGKLCG